MVILVDPLSFLPLQHHSSPLPDPVASWRPVLPKVIPSRCGLPPEPLEPRTMLAGVPLRVVAVTERPAPGLPGLSLARNPFGGDSPYINNAGDIVFGHHLSGPGVNETNDFAKFLLRPDAPPVVYREGDPALGYTGAETYNSL